MDERYYLKYFKQRSETSNWSEKNKKLVQELEARGLMTGFGRTKIEIARQNGHWNPARPEPLTNDQMQQFEELLKPHETAYANFMKMSRSARLAYMGSYFHGAKTDMGKQNRFNTIVERLNLNLNPMESIKKKQK